MCFSTTCLPLGLQQLPVMSLPLMARKNSTKSATLVVFFVFLFSFPIWPTDSFQDQQIKPSNLLLLPAETEATTSLVRRAGLEQDLNITPMEQQEHNAATLPDKADVALQPLATLAHHAEPLPLSFISSIGSMFQTWSPYPGLAPSSSSTVSSLIRSSESLNLDDQAQDQAITKSSFKDKRKRVEELIKNGRATKKQIYAFHRRQRQKKKEEEDINREIKPNEWLRQVVRSLDPSLPLKIKRAQLIEIYNKNHWLLPSAYTIGRTIWYQHVGKNRERARFVAAERSGQLGALEVNSMTDSEKKRLEDIVKFFDPMWSFDAKEETIKMIYKNNNWDLPDRDLILKAIMGHVRGNFGQRATRETIGESRPSQSGNFREASHYPSPSLDLPPYLRMKQDEEDIKLVRRGGLDQDLNQPSIPDLEDVAMEAEATHHQEIPITSDVVNQYGGAHQGATPIESTSSTANKIPYHNREAVTTEDIAGWTNQVGSSLQSHVGVNSVNNDAAFGSSSRTSRPTCEYNRMREK